MGDCLFCKIVNGEIPADKVYSDEDVVAFRDIDPKAPVHVLVIPTSHIEKVADLEEADKDVLMKMFLTANRVARDEGIAENGYRLVFNNGKNAGQAVFHIHLHVLGGRALTWPPG